MTFWRKLLSLLPWHRAAQERDMQEELESLKAMAGKNELGNLTLVAEGARDTWRWNWLDACWSDIRFSLRTLMRSPGFALTSILVLSVGVGLNLTFFQLINIVFLKPLPIRDPESLVRVEIPEGLAVLDNAAAQLIATHNNAFSAVLTQTSTHQGREIIWNRNVTDPLRAHFVSVNWFEELGVRALRGELFTATTAAISRPIAVISEHYWETRLQRDPAIVGTTVLLNHRPVTIVGIVPLNQGVLWGNSPQLWIPTQHQGYIQSGLLGDQGPDPGVAVYGRLRPDLSIDAAKASLKPAVDEIIRQRPRRLSIQNSVSLLRGSNHFRSPNSKNRMWAIIGICGSFTMLILLIACANLANLVLSRAAGRMQELSVRAALGASRSRVLRHLVSETAILATLASAGALFLAYAGTRLFVAYAEDLVPRDLALDWRTMAAAVVATILTTALVGLLPAWNIGKRDLAIAMRDGGQQASAGLSRVRQRQILLAAQVAGSCLLIVVAGLVLRSLQHMLVPPGLDYENVIVAEQNTLRGDAARPYWANLKQVISEIPGIESAAVVGSIPFQTSLRVERLESRPSIKFIQMRVEPEFFQVMHMPFLAGTPFDSSAAGDNPVVVSKSMALQLYGSSAAVEMRLAEIGTIVGVVDDVRLGSPDAMDFPQVYAPLRDTDYDILLIRARTKAEAARLVPGLAQTMQDHGAGVPRIRLLEAALESQIRPTQILSAILSSLAALALTVACMGIFGVVSYNVAVRRKEIGIRVALGARHGSVMLLMVQQLVWPVAVAIIAGMFGGVLVGRIFESNGGPFSPPDTPVMTMVALIILTAVAFACVVPTMRALRSSDSRVL